MLWLTATIAGQVFYFCGSIHDYEWSRDQDRAARFVDEDAARADLVGSPMAYDHYVMRARATPSLL